MYKTFSLNRDTGELVALNASEEGQGARVFCVDHVALNQPDINDMSDDPDELLQVLSTKVQRLCQQRTQGSTGTPFEAGVRDALPSAQRLFEKIIGRKSVKA